MARGSSVALELPRGRHRLSREEVAASQRHRLLRAMTSVVAEVGYARTTAAAVYGRAGVSSRAFYENFRDKQECYLAAYDDGVDDFLRRVRAADATGSGAPLERFRALVERYLAVMAHERDFARAFLLEVYGAGPEALARRLEVQARFVALAGELLRPRKAADRFAVEALVSAITFRVTETVAADRLDELPRLAPRLEDVAQRLCPWVAAH